MSEKVISDIKLQAVSITDLPAIVQIHRAAFPSSMITQLGQEAIRRYYDWQLTGPHDAITMGAYSNQKLISFCFGGKFRGALSGYVKKNRWFLVCAVLTHPAIIRNEDFINKLMQSLSILKPFPKKNKLISEAKEKKWRSFGILSIAVDPAFKKSGIGHFIMEYMEKKAKSLGFRQMNLTVHHNNKQAIAFYEHLGWSRVYKDSAWNGSMSKQL